MKITIVTVPHAQQRYETCGDWHYNKDTQEINVVVSEMGDWRKEFLLAMHELVEAGLCMYAGITNETVDAFDMKYEANRDLKDLISEPGDDPKAPYRQQHFYATTLERSLSVQLDIEWEQYEKDIQSLSR